MENLYLRLFSKKFAKIHFLRAFVKCMDSKNLVFRLIYVPNGHI